MFIRVKESAGGKDAYEWLVNTDHIVRISYDGHQTKIFTSDRIPDEASIVLAKEAFDSLGQILGVEK